MPFSRSRRTAASISPFVSCSARLVSMIGAPVWSRSSLTSAAEISAIRLHLLGHRLFHGGNLLGVGRGRGLALRHRLLLLRSAIRLRRRREVRRGGLLLAGRDAV